MKYSFLPLVLLVLIASPLLALSAATTITVTTQPVYHPGQTVFIEGTAPANTQVGVTIYNPQGKAVFSNVTTSNANGVYSLKAFTFPSQATTTLPYGTYTVQVGTSTGFTNSTTFQFLPLTATVRVLVVNPQGVPVSGATVTADSVSATTNSSGVAVLSLPTGNYTLKVVPPSPYAPTSESISVVAPNMYSFTVTVQIQELSLTVVKAVSPNVNLQDLTSGTGITMTGGTTLTIWSTVTFAGAPISTATVIAMYNGTNYTATYMNGYYVVNISVPNVQYETDLILTASYSGMTSTPVVLPLTVNLNEQKVIESLNATVTSLSQQVTSLSSTVSSLSSTVSSLSSTVSSLSTTLGKLNSTLGSLQQSVSTLSSEYTTLNSKVNALSGLSGTVDIALAVSIIAIIISIVVLILLFRKVS
ncbi:alpha-2-macroglobulin [Metallosphaera tengchongensis]|uniref:Alpha-2-macroglobulin n=1 Tax=Metallosphaera tengchongensis TaxID=1532350 RepID=A0A6N0NU60_9CREN|nr:S-layer protein SlaB [Metallosphaera tengchongensis]QKQ99442.1 alpha-2-macroglobulin [Metallosphaera tengchongensis]